MRALLVTKEFSATPTSGGMLRTLALLEQLAGRYRTTVISPDGVHQAGPGMPLHEMPLPAPAAPNLASAARLHDHERVLVPGSVGSEATSQARLHDHGRPFLPVIMQSCCVLARYRSISGARIGGTRLLANLRRARGRYDVGIIDHTCLAGLADDVAAGCDQLVVSMHNLESDLMAQRAATAPPRARIAMLAETRLLRRLEAQVAARHPVLVCTEADARALPSRYGTIVGRNGIFAGPEHAPGTGRPGMKPRTAELDGEAELTGMAAPEGVAVADGLPVTVPAYSMVFAGALDWAPNVEGLLWFAREIWPLIRDRLPEASVTVAGRRPGAELIAGCTGPGLRLLADPPLMAPVLAAHRLGIVPLRSGGGSRIKILEYLAAGLGVVSTGIGAAGLDDVPDQLLDRVPTDPRAFADQVVARLRTPPPDQHRSPKLHGSSEQHGRLDARDWVRGNYSWDITLAPLLDFLQDRDHALSRLPAG